VLAFLLIALGSMMKILPNHVQVCTQWKWIEEASWVVVCGGITLWICSKYMQRRLADRGKIESDGNKRDEED